MVFYWMDIKEEEGHLRIVIEDAGKGFSEAVLEKLKKGKTVFADGTEHVGIYNIRRRLEIMYGSEAQIRFSNTDRGAGIEIQL